MTARVDTPQARAYRSTEPRQRRVKTTPLEARARGLDTSTKAAAALIDPSKPLTEKQLLFVKFWAQGESIISASLKAGYADGAMFAYRMVHMPNVLAVYHAEKAKYEEACGMTRKKVMEGLLEAVEMAKLLGEPSTMVAGWREVGKMLGYYEPVKVQHTVSVEGKIVHERLNALSDDELLQLIENQARSHEPQPQPALPAPDGDPS